MYCNKTFFCVLLFCFLNVFAVHFLEKSTVFERMLLHDDIQSIESLHSFFERQNIVVPFTSEVYVIYFYNGERAIFKPVQEDDVRYAYAEVAAYKASQWLKFPFVPPTVLRTINGMWGSLQLYVQGCHDLPVDDLEQKQAYNLFCFIFGQWDLSKENRLVYKDGDTRILVAIDNANIADRQKCKYGEHPYVCVWAEDNTFYDAMPFLFDSALHFCNPTQTDLYDFFISCMPVWKAKRLSLRLSKRTVVSCINHHGTIWLQALENEKPFSEMIPLWCLEKICALDKKTIQSFFADAPEGLFSDAFFDDIIDRQQQVFAYFCKDKQTLNGITT